MATSVADPLPKLYIYDHCPFCVRARIIFGLKKVEHELVFVANHDEATPIGLVGSKQTPILQLPSGKAFPESLDIVRYVDENYGGPVVVEEASGREDLKNWFQKAEPIYLLHFPRVVAAPFAEFAQRVSREYFQSKKEKTFGLFSDLVARTPEMIVSVDKMLEELEGMIHSETSFNAGGVSYDDITLFGVLRGLTLVKDIKWPPKVLAYTKHFAEAGDIPLLFSMAKF